MLDSKKIFQKICALERALDLDDQQWLYHGFHLWPIYRLNLARLLFDEGTEAPVGTRKPNLRLLLSGLFQAFPKNREGSVWFISNGVTWQKMEENEIDRLSGPLAMACKKQNIPYLIVDRGSPQPRCVPEDTFYQWWAPKFYRSKVWAVLAAFLWPDRKHERLVSKINNAANTLGIRLPPISAKNMEVKARSIQLLACWLEKEMCSQQVPTVFVVCYYDVAGHAASLAARRAGIPCVDLQHGITGPYHPAYANWQRMPGSGYHLLPSIFWAWDQSSQGTVDRWAQSQSIPHQAILGGHPFYEAWDVGDLTVQKDTQKNFSELLARSQGYKKVLVTLQWGLISPQSLAPLLAAMEQQNGIAWWLRLHPMALSDRDDVKKILPNKAKSSIDIDLTTSLPLPLLLGEVDMHATHSSSTVLDANFFKIPSIVWSQYGIDLFEEYIGRTNIFGVLNGTEFMSVLASIDGAAAIQNKKEKHMLNALKLILESDA